MAYIFSGQIKMILPSTRTIKLARTVVGITHDVIKKKNRVDIAKRIAHDVQQLGPLYIKAGQFVSSRNDIFGKEVVREFSFLRDSITPIAYDEVRKCIAKAGIIDAFSHIDPKPIASASIGQVHVATLKGVNKKVILKVKRPNIEQEVREQLGVLKCIMSWVKKLNVENIDETKKVLDDFEAVILDEIDFEKERANIQKFYKMYQKSSDVIVPNTYDHLCSTDIIVMEFIDSIDIHKHSGENKMLSRKIMELFIDQLLYNGILHGDPHLGNIRITKQGAIVMYDFGNVLQLSESERHQLKELVCQLVIGNTTGVMNTMKKIGIKIEDEKTAREYITKYMEYMKTIDINTFKSGTMMANGNVKIPMRINNTIIRIIRIFGMVEGTCKELDPSFNYFDLLETYIDAIFFDDDFLLYKISTDTALLFENILHLTNNDLREQK